MHIQNNSNNTKIADSGLPQTFLSFQALLCEQFRESKPYALGVAASLALPDEGQVPRYVLDGADEAILHNLTDLPENRANKLISEVDSRKDTAFDFTAANMFRVATDGVYVEIPRGVEKKQVTLQSECETAAADIVVIDVGEKSDIDLILTSQGELVRTVIVRARPHAKLELSWRTTAAMFQNVFIIAEEGADVTVVDSGVSGNNLYSRMTCYVQQEACCTFRGVYVASGEVQMDNAVSVYHEGSKSRSDVRTYGVLLDTAHVIERSLIDIPKRLMGVEGTEDGRFLMLSKTARMDAIPGLDIASGQVSCTHALAIDTIDDMEMYYPLIRGISKEEARTMLMRAVLMQGTEGLSETLAQQVETDIEHGLKQVM